MERGYWRRQEAATQSDEGSPPGRPQEDTLSHTPTRPPAPLPPLVTRPDSDMTRLKDDISYPQPPVPPPVPRCVCGEINPRQVSMKGRGGATRPDGEMMAF